MKKTTRRSSLLLIELIIAILIFSLTGALCLQLFVKSHSLGKRTEELDMAVRQAVSVSELIAQKDGLEHELSQLYPDADMDPGNIIIYYNRNFEECSHKDAYYQMNILSSDTDERLTSYKISVCKDSNTTTIYSMETTAYNPLQP